METKTKNLIFTIVFGTLSVVLVMAAVLIKHQFSSSPWDGTVYNLSDVKFFLDRLLAHPFSEKIHKAGNIFCVANISLLPLFFLIYAVKISENKSKTFFAICCLYVITFCFDKACYDLLKVLVHRIRPYMYFSDPSAKGILNGDFQHSWPSGHSTNAFMGIGFVTAGLLLMKDKSRFKNIFIITGYTIAITTAVLRILSGNHFLTDVLSGAVLGSLIGYGITLINNKFGIKVYSDRQADLTAKSK